MPKEGNNWEIEVDEHDKNNNLVYETDGKVCKTQIKMDNAKFSDGTHQSLYWPTGHKHASVFKGMAKILQEQGFENAPKLLAQCKGFKCEQDATACCCHRILYTQPDFVNVPSILQTFCKHCSYHVIFLLKFHYELNFIEQCWGYAKRLYRQFPASSKEADLDQNVVTSLEAIPIEVMQ